jgi:cytochrome P450
MRSGLKDFLWSLYRRTGPLHSTALWLRLIHAHGYRRGRTRFACLPPGDLAPAGRDIRRDQRHFLKQSRRFGPIFKRQLRGRLLIAIVGNASGKRFLAENAERLTAQAKQLQGFFPIGHLRAMTGETHRSYRRDFVNAMRPETIAACDDVVRAVVDAELDRLVGQHREQPISTASIIEALRTLTTRGLLRILLGIDPQSPRADYLLQCYNSFSGVYAPTKRYAGDDVERFAAIRTVVDELVAELRNDQLRDLPPCVLTHLASEGATDDTSLGNLIYMVESGRFDIYSLMRWMLKYLAENPSVAARVDTSSGSGAGGPTPYATAVVMETLRCNQSEALNRLLTSDTEFDGFFFPAGSQIRICVWERHKDQTAFPEPFKFDPERFLSSDHAIDRYAPFGLDRHRCVAADLVVRFAALFVEQLCRRYALETVDDGAAVWGEYHWEPSRLFAMRLRDRARPLE